MLEYTLYLDESYTQKYNGKEPAFAIGGIIVKDDYIPIINSKVDSLKELIWSDLPNYKDIVLHEKELKDAIENRKPKNELRSEYVRFRNNKAKADTVYKEMSKIIKNSELYTIGCVVDKSSYDINFPKIMGNDISLVCMQIIIENFTHFLYQKNAIGKIIYESRDAQDKVMLMRFYQVSANGTMYVRPDAIQQKIVQIKFIPKADNIQCLQVADFIPNQIARKKTGKKIHINVKDLTNNILRKSYDGNNGKFSRYGIKLVPRMT